MPTSPHEPLSIERFLLFEIVLLVCSFCEIIHEMYTRAIVVYGIECKSITDFFHFLDPVQNIWYIVKSL